MLQPPVFFGVFFRSHAASKGNISRRDSRATRLCIWFLLDIVIFTIQKSASRQRLKK